MCGVRAGVDPGGMRAPWVGVVGCVRLEPFPSLSVGVVPESIRWSRSRVYPLDSFPSLSVGPVPESIRWTRSRVYPLESFPSLSFVPFPLGTSLALNPIFSSFYSNWSQLCLVICIGLYFVARDLQAVFKDCLVYDRKVRYL